MSNQVILVDDQGIKKVMNHYASSKLYAMHLALSLRRNLPDTAITAYKSGKVLFQGAGADERRHDGALQI